MRRLIANEIVTAWNGRNGHIKEVFVRKADGGNAPRLRPLRVRITAFTSISTVGTSPGPCGGWVRTTIKGGHRIPGGGFVLEPVHHVFCTELAEPEVFPARQEGAYRCCQHCDPRCSVASRRGTPVTQPGGVSWRTLAVASLGHGGPVRQDRSSRMHRAPADRRFFKQSLHEDCRHL